MRDIYQVQVQHTAGAYKTVQLFYREQDALDYLTAVAAMHPEYPYDGKSWKYAVGSSVHHKDRYRIIKDGLEEKVLTPLKTSAKI